MAFVYRTLDVEKVISTIQILSKRIDERFPSSGLGKVCKELEDIAEETRKRIEWISTPNKLIRIGVGIVLALILGVLLFTIASLEFKTSTFGIADLVQIMEATINDFVLIGAAIFFLINIEGRIKRRRAMKVLHEIRSIVHVIDMHQLTKNPNRKVEDNTENSPKIELNPVQLDRYLDYCSEMLSISAKISALYAQAIDDPIILQAVNEIENLSTSLSRKIWQKIMLLKQQNIIE